jgi:hypothetical protein
MAGSVRGTAHALPCVPNATSGGSIVEGCFATRRGVDFWREMIRQSTSLLVVVQNDSGSLLSVELTLLRSGGGFGSGPKNFHRGNVLAHLHICGAAPCG